MYERTSIYAGLNNIVNKTGGRTITIVGSDDIDNKISSFISSIVKEDTKFSKNNCNLNEEWTDRLIARIKPHKIHICEVDTNAVITYSGIKYHGLADIINAEKLDPSIVIDHDVDRNSGACNIVFVQDPPERDRKQSVLQKINATNTYCKLNQNTPLDVLPMIYYNGMGNKMMLCGLEYEEME